MDSPQCCNCHSLCAATVGISQVDALSLSLQLDHTMSLATRHTRGRHGYNGGTIYCQEDRTCKDQGPRMLRMATSGIESMVSRGLFSISSNCQGKTAFIAYWMNLTSDISYPHAWWTASMEKRVQAINQKATKHISSGLETQAPCEMVRKRGQSRSEGAWQCFSAGPEVCSRVDWGSKCCYSAHTTKQTYFIFRSRRRTCTWSKNL